jgi:cobalt-zinc-cadmium efflux system outer membrane protein
MKSSSVYFTILLLALACRAEPPPSGARLTLAAATQTALADNRSLHEVRARWEAMKARVPQAAAWDDLKIGTTTSLGRFVDVPRNSFTDHMLTVEQMIPISGKNQSRARIAAAEAVGTLEELRRKELDVVLKVRTAFIRMINTRALLELNRATEASLSQTLTISRGQLEVGTQSQTDVLMAEGGVIRISEARRDLERTLSEQETQLKVLMNRDAFSALGEPVGELPAHAAVDVARARSLLLSNRPELRMASANIASAAAKVELAKREWIPDPTLSVGAQRYNDASQAVSEITAGVSFNVPWVNPRKYRAGESEAQSTAAAAQQALEGARTEALGMLRDQVTKIEVAHHHVMLSGEGLVPNARQLLEASRASYESGKVRLLDFITAQRNLLEAQSMERGHVADYQVALAELEALVGADLQLFSSGTRTAQPAPMSKKGGKR